jgi:DNA-binding NtrC family response regulator
MRAVVFNPERLHVQRFRAALRMRGWDVLEPGSEAELLAAVRENAAGLVVLEAAACCDASFETARRVRQLDRDVAMLLVVSSCEGPLALTAMRAGINDVLPFSSSDAEIGGALSRLTPDLPPARPQRELLAGEKLVGQSRTADELRRAIQRVAACDSNVLITGETGTGKELAAELIHSNSTRADRPFVSINCAAIPDGLLESELFGYERGAFTGAHAAREGKLQYARGGTLFLDEVGDMSLYAQAKILRAIESRKVQRLGGNRDISVNIRIIAATNQNLEQLTSQQKFRQDLYFRLNVARIQLTPLREHADDIPELVQHVLRELTARLGRSVEAIDPSYLEPLLRYPWPGNIRELRNVIESTLVFCSERRITRRDLPPYLRALFASEERKSETERERIAGALRSTGWNRNDAARLLGCSRMTLYRKMVRYELFEEAIAEPPARNSSLPA